MGIEEKGEGEAEMMRSIAPSDITFGNEKQLVN